MVVAGRSSAAFDFRGQPWRVHAARWPGRPTLAVFSFSSRSVGVIQPRRAATESVRGLWRRARWDRHGLGFFKILASSTRAVEMAPARSPRRRRNRVLRADSNCVLRPETSFPQLAGIDSDFDSLWLSRCRGVAGLVSRSANSFNGPGEPRGDYKNVMQQLCPLRGQQGHGCSDL